MSAAAPPPYDEPATLDELVFALGRRDEPTVALVECASLAKRRELEAQLAERMPEYRYHVLDVTPYSVVSLLRTLEEELPAEIKASQPVQWVVHVHGLENSRLLSQDGQLVPSPLTAQLNLERERLFRSVPYLIVLWGDADFFRTLQREAPDFWHWVTYRFRFEDHTARPVSELPPLPPERLPERGNVAERRARIAELQERYDHLALNDSDKKRLLKDKIDILSLLGAEYAEAFLYKEAEETYKLAIALRERLPEGRVSLGKLWYDLGHVYLSQVRLPEALDSYERSKYLASGIQMGAVFSQIGAVYCEQQQWESALKNYQQAMEWELGAGSESRVGGTYLRIGMLHRKQQQWALALDNYRQALDWSGRAGDELGMEQTYHQIGMVYQQQNLPAQALENYEQAIERQQRTGDVFGAASTCFQIGQLLIEQQFFKEAVPWFERAIVLLTEYGHPFLPHAEDALAETRLRLQEANQQVTPADRAEPGEFLVNL